MIEERTQSCEKETRQCQPQEERLPASNMLLFGAAGRNLGKTELAVRMIRSYAAERAVTGIKVVTVHDHGDICPRGGKGCGICKSLKTCFDIREEKGTGNKDTMRFRDAGAATVYLVRSFPEGLKAAMTEVLSRIPEEHVIICESNSAALAVKPAAFFMISDENGEWKPSARQVEELADEIVNSDEASFEAVLMHYGSGGEKEVQR